MSWKNFFIFFEDEWICIDFELEFFYFFILSSLCIFTLQVV